MSRKLRGSMRFAGDNPLLSAVTSDIQLPTGLDAGARHTLGGALPVVAVALVVLAVLLLWAVFLRKPARRRERGRLLEKKAAAPKPAPDGGSGKKLGRRRRRETHRPRNPTLSETGGLPPLGAGDQLRPPL